MKKIMFCYCKYIISKYFRILQNAKEIKENYLKNLKENNEKIACFQHHKNINYLKKCFFLLSLAKAKTTSNNQKMVIIKQKQQITIKKKIMIIWKNAFFNKRRKKESLFKINDYFLKKSAQVKAENFSFMKIHTDSKKNLMEEMKILSKSEIDIRLEIKYQNLEKLIKRKEFKGSTY